MTTGELHFFNGIYLTFFVIAAYLTRATPRRIAGAMAGGVIVGVMILGIIQLGEAAGWWHMTIRWEPYFLTLMMLGMSFSGFLYLCTWRIARRFGWPGLAVVVLFAAIIGPPRDYWYMAKFPHWGAYAPGIAPIAAISVTYILIVVVGHGVMRLVAGPATSDRLART